VAVGLVFITGFLFEDFRTDSGISRDWQIGMGKKKPPGGRRFLEIRCVFSAYAKVSLPPEALESPKISKRKRCRIHLLECSTGFKEQFQ
jgi:hypothetical protein